MNKPCDIWYATLNISYCTYTLWYQTCCIYRCRYVYIYVYIDTHYIECMIHVYMWYVHIYIYRICDIWFISIDEIVAIYDIWYRTWYMKHDIWNMIYEIWLRFIWCVLCYVKYVWCIIEHKMQDIS